MNVIMLWPKSHLNTHHFCRMKLSFVEEEETSDPQPSGEQPEPQISDETATLVYRLHCKFGHPANSTLARTLRLGGAKTEIVEAAKRISCSTCNRVRPPKDPPKVGVSKADQFNQKVGIDIFLHSGLWSKVTHGVAHGWFCHFFPCDETGWAS